MSEEQASSPASIGEKIKQAVFLALRISIGAGIIAYLISRNYKTLEKALGGFNVVWLIPAMILYLIHLMLSAWRWRVLLFIQKVKISFFEAFSLTMQGVFFSLAMPGSLGGDVIKGAFIAKRAPAGKRFNGVFTILIDRVLGMTALFSLALVAAAFSYNFIINVKGLMGAIIYSLLIGSAACLSAVFVLLTHRQLEKIALIKWGIDFADKITRGVVHRLMNAADGYRSEWRKLLQTVLVSIFFIHLFLAGVVYCLARGIDAPQTPPGVYIMATSIGNAAGSLPLSPMGAGTRDAVISEIIGASYAEQNPSITHETAMGLGVAVALLYTALVLFFNLSGGFFFMFDKIAASRR